MRRTRLSLAALAVASSAVLGLPTAALAGPDASAGTAVASDSAPADDAADAAPEGGAKVAKAASTGDVVQLVAMNDFHGRISPQPVGDGEAAVSRSHLRETTI